jgi:4-hydroxybenzoyl-CoA thioesterase
MESTREFESRKLIRFQHCDPAGIVFYPQYFILFHELIEDWFGKGLGLDYGEFISMHRLGVPTVRLECDFVASSTIGETLAFRLVVRKVGKTSIALSLTAHAGEQLRVRIEQVLVLFSLESRQAVPISPDLRNRMMKFVGGDQLVTR